MKYKLYRSFGNLDVSIKKHELVAVEYGKDIWDVCDNLIQDVRDDLTGTPEYENYEISAYAPEPVECFRRVKRYQYEMMGVAMPFYPARTRIIYFGIIEESE